MDESQAAGDAHRTYQYVVPEKANDGWETAPLASENVNANLIKDLFERVSNNSYTNISSVIIVKNGNVTLEGVVSRPMDKQIAEMQTKSVPNVFSVTDNLQVEESK